VDIPQHQRDPGEHGTHPAIARKRAHVRLSQSRRLRE
jgi:hypothetical protein